MVAIQPQSIPLFTGVSVTSSLSSILAMTGVFTDTQTVTINSVVFTSVNVLSGVAGQFKIGTTTAETLANLANLINNPTVTNTTQVALSNANALAIKVTAGITAQNTVTSLTLFSSNNSALTVAETQTNGAWTTTHVSNGFAPVVRGIVSIQFSSTGITSGNGVLTVEVSNDGYNWTAYNRLVTNVTNTNAQTDTRVASVTLSTNASSIVVIPDPFAFYRVLCAVTTDGLYTATAYVV